MTDRELSNYLNSLKPWKEGYDVTCIDWVVSGYVNEVTDIIDDAINKMMKPP
jgi:hypothetical protein